MKLLSETQGNRNCWRRIFGLWCNRQVYWSKLCQSPWTRNKITPDPNQSLQCGWDPKQTRNDQILYWSEHWNTWMKKEGTAICDWTWETEDCIGIYMARRNQPDYWLGKGNSGLEEIQIGKETNGKGKTDQDNCTITEEKDEEEHLNSTQNPIDNSELSLLIATITGDTDNDVWINSKSTNATRIQAEINSKKKVLPLEEQIPEEFHEFLDVFSEEKAAWFPEPWPWDYKIETKENFVPKSFKTYNLTLLRLQTIKLLSTVIGSRVCFWSLVLISL